jgi:hypothetical protein
MKIKSKLLSCLLTVMLCMVNSIPAFAMSDGHIHDDLSPEAIDYCSAGGNHLARSNGSGYLDYVYNNVPGWGSASLYKCYNCGAEVVCTGYPAAAYPYIGYYTFDFETNTLGGSNNWKANVVHYTSSGYLTGWSFFPA